MIDRRLAVLALSLSLSTVSAEVRTLSLKQIEREAGARPADATATLGGLTDITGYSWDKRTQDIQILGEADAKGTPILVAEFAPALRIRSKSGAGMTLIPKNFADPRSPQQVHSFPPEIAGTALEQALVDADYLGKRLAFEALAAHHRHAIKDCAAGPSEARSSPARIVFLSAPPQFAFEETGSGFTVHFKSADVVLMAESDLLAVSGAAQKLPADDPVAQFAARFTKDLPDIERKEPVFHRMHKMFKVFLLAQSLHQDPDLAYDFSFWDTYVAARFETPREFPSYRPVVLKQICWGRPYEYSAIVNARQVYGGIVMDYSGYLDRAHSDTGAVAREARARVSGTLSSWIRSAAPADPRSLSRQPVSAFATTPRPSPRPSAESMLTFGLTSSLTRLPAFILGSSGFSWCRDGPVAYTLVRRIDGLHPDSFDSGYERDERLYRSAAAPLPWRRDRRDSHLLSINAQSIRRAALAAFACTVLRAQVPERFRLDMSIGLLSASGSTGFLVGEFTPRAGVIPSVKALGIFDLSATVNVTHRLTISAGMPFGMATRSQSNSVLSSSQPLLLAPEFAGGSGDAHAEVAFDAVPERKASPNVGVRVEVGAPTATFSLLKSNLWRATTRVNLSKSVHPRFSVFVDGSHSHFPRRADLRLEPIRSYGGGLGIGITRASILTLQTEQVFGGRRTVGGAEVFPSTRDLRAGVGMTRFRRGRPRVSIVLFVGGLRSDPTLLAVVRFPILSLGRPE